MTEKIIEMAERICKELNIKVKPVNTKQDIIEAKNFSATLKPTRQIIEIK
jgi:hypothetical protein